MLFVLFRVFFVLFALFFCTFLLFLHFFCTFFALLSNFTTFLQIFVLLNVLFQSKNPKTQKSKNPKIQSSPDNLPGNFGFLDFWIFGFLDSEDFSHSRF